MMSGKEILMKSQISQGTNSPTTANNNQVNISNGLRLATQSSGDEQDKKFDNIE